MDHLTPLRDWMFRAISLEAEAERFRSAGIRVGATQNDVEQSLIEQFLAPFPLNIRNRALRMSRLYVALFCLENSMRELVEQKL